MSTATTATRYRAGEDRVVRTADDVAGLGTILGVWAHPDDEVYHSAGIMAAAAEAGNRVVVITATRGEHGTDQPQQWPPARLAARRARELAAALAVLDAGRGRIEHHFLGAPTGSRYVDGSLATGSGERAVAELAEIIDDVHPDTTLTFGPDGITGHPDHRAVSMWTDQALALLPWIDTRLMHATLAAEWHRDFAGVLAAMDDGDDHFPSCPHPELAVDLTLGSADLDRKLAALGAHASQFGPLRRALGRQRYRALVSTEWFRLPPSPPSGYGGIPDVGVPAPRPIFGQRPSHRGGASDEGEDDA
jgi:LmbE family N-acetylglucosaminyl deacetylase